MKWTGARFLVLNLAVLAVSGCGGSNTVPYAYNQTENCTTPAAPEFAYSLGNSGGYTVSMYTVDTCGAFDATTPATVATGYASPQLGAEQMVVDPLGRFAYVANLVSNSTSQSTISMFTINSSTGVLTATNPATVPTGFYPQGIAIDPKGRFVYTANSDDNTVSMFTINQTTGVLTAEGAISTQSDPTRGTNSSPDSVTVDPTGNFLYAVNQDQGTVSMFTINQTTGLLTPTTPAWVDTGSDPFAIAVSPNGKFAYVANNSSGPTQGVWQYTITPGTGVLTPNTPASLGAGNGPTAVVVDPSNRFAYVTNRTDNTISMYTINPTTGNLSPNQTDVFPGGTMGTGSQPFRILFDSAGKFLYSVNQQAEATVYTLRADGTLALAGNAGGAGAPSLSVAIAP